MIFIPANYVKQAVAQLGGPTRVANKLGVSSATVHVWIKKGRVANFDKAELLASLSKLTLRQLRGI